MADAQQLADGFNDWSSEITHQHLKQMLVLHACEKSTDKLMLNTAFMFQTVRSLTLTISSPYHLTHKHDEWETFEHSVRICD